MFTAGTKIIIGLPITYERLRVRRFALVTRFDRVTANPRGGDPHSRLPGATHPSIATLPHSNFSAQTSFGYRPATQENRGCIVLGWSSKGATTTGLTRQRVEAFVEPPRMRRPSCASGGWRVRGAALDDRCCAPQTACRPAQGVVTRGDHHCEPSCWRYESNVVAGVAPRPWDLQPTRSSSSLAVGPMGNAASANAAILHMESRS
jgi:hypothetical protein